MIKGVVFDWNGLIADTEELHRLAFSEALRLHGFQGEVSKKEWSRYCGVGDEGTSRMLLEDYNIDCDPEVLFREKQPIYARLVNREIEFMPGFERLYDMVRARGLRCIVASGSERVFLEREMKALGLFGELQHVCVQDVGKPKSDPAIFYLAADRIDLKPEECFLFEDGVTGVKTGNSIGMKTVFLKTYGECEEAFMQVDCLEDITESIFD